MYILLENNPMIIPIVNVDDDNDDGYNINEETIEKYNTDIKTYLEYSYGRLK